MKHYFADFETSTNKWSSKNSYVWLAGLMDERENFQIDISLNGFMQRLEQMTHSAVVWFHNGKSFDFEYLKHWFGTNREYGLDSNKLEPKQWSGLFQNKSNTYSLTYKNKWGYKIVFKDSNLFMSGKLSKAPNSVKMRVNEGYYHIERHLKSVDDINEVDYHYLKWDCLSLKRLMTSYFKVNKHRMQSYTKTSLAFAEFKKDIQYNKYYKNKISLDEWKEFKPYCVGGMTRIGDGKEQKLIKNIMSVDFNSLYPATMYNTPMPIGEPIYGCKWGCDHKFSMIKAIISAKAKPNVVGFIPSYNNGNLLGSITWHDEVENYVIFTTKHYLEKINQYYNITYINIQSYICFETTNGVGIDFIDKYQDIKQHAPKDSAERQDAKDKQNACYGRFAMSPIQEKYYMREKKPDEKIFEYQTEYGKYIVDVEESISDEIGYLPMAIAILNNSKSYYMIDALQKVGKKNFVYADTDSIHFITPSEDEGKKLFLTHPTKLGYLESEGHYKYGYYIARKFYVIGKDLDQAPCKMGTSKIDKEKSFKGKTLRQIINKDVDMIQTFKVRVDGGIFIDQRKQVIKGWNDML